MLERVNKHCRQPMELIPRERAPGLPVFAIALRCVPYIMPEHWAGGRVCDDLPGTQHSTCQ